MNFATPDLPAISNIIAAAATDGMFAKLLTALGLDPNNLSFTAVFNRLTNAAWAYVNIASALALIGAVFFVATLLMRTMVPLRICGIISDVFFIGYGVLANSVTTFFLYLLLLPINIFRLQQMLKLVKKAQVAAQGDLSMDWLRPFMARRKYRKGDVLFRKGEPASEMFITGSGKFLVTEIGIELPPGRVVGELGFLAPDNKRTQTVECTEDGEVLTISYERLLELYFQNPEFGYYFLRLTSERLLQNVARLEAIIEQNRAATPSDTVKDMKSLSSGE